MLDLNEISQTGISKQNDAARSCAKLFQGKILSNSLLPKVFSIGFLLVSFLFESTEAHCQAPPFINYQAVARHADSGEEVAHQSVYIICKILAGAQGNIVYQEEHSNISTNQFGLFNLKIGGGEPLAGSFNNINWGNAGYWLELDMDAGSGLETIGSMQFVSVPYALHAETVDNADDADADPTNELINEVTFNSSNFILTIQEAGIVHTTDLSSMVYTGGNELVESLNFNPQTSTLTLMEGGNSFDVNLSPLIEDGDADDQNELINSFLFDTNTFTLSIQEGGNTHTTSLSGLVNEGNNDNDPANELIEIVNFNPVTSELTIQDAGNTYTVNLAALINDADPDPENELLDNVSFNSGTSELTIEDAGNTFVTDLTSLIDDADPDPANELLDNVSFNSGTSELTIEDAGNTFVTDLTSLIDDADADPANELLETVSFNAGTSELIIEDAGNTFVTDLTSLIDDADPDPANELIQNFSFNAPLSILTLTDAGASHNINLSALINDPDPDPTNELQTLAQVLTYGGGLVGDAEGLRFVNLGNPISDQDAATKYYVDRMPLVGDLSGSLESATVVAIQGVEVSNDTPSDGQVLLYNSSNSQWEPSSSAGMGINSPQYYAVDPADFVGMRRNGNADKYGIALFDQASEYVTIHKDDEGDKIIAPLHLPHNTKLSEIKVMFKKTNAANNLGILLERKDLFTGNKTNIYAFSSSSETPGLTIQVDTEDLNSVGLAMRTIDNSQYSYRIIADFNTVSDFNQASDVRIMLYGIRLKYEY